MSEHRPWAAWCDGVAGAVLAALDDEDDWRDRALCAETDPDLHFPATDEGAGPAKGVCRACFVQTACLAYALVNPEKADDGVWGGMTATERQRLREAA